MLSFLNLKISNLIIEIADYIFANPEKKLRMFCHILSINVIKPNELLIDISKKPKNTILHACRSIKKNIFEVLDIQNHEYSKSWKPRKKND
jgi:hypothetical protein